VPQHNTSAGIVHLSLHNEEKCSLIYKGTDFLTSKFIPKQNILVYAYTRKLMYIARVSVLVVNVQFPILQQHSLSVLALEYV